MVSLVIEGGYLNVLKYLLEDLGFKIKNNSRMAHFARTKGHQHVADYLISLKSN